MEVFHGQNATAEIARLALFMTIVNNYNQLMTTIRIVIPRRNTFCEVGTEKRAIFLKVPGIVSDILSPAIRTWLAIWILFLFARVKSS